MQHAKTATFSAIQGPAGIIRNITFVASGNLTHDGVVVSWNVTIVTVEDKTIYDATAGYIRLMRFDKTAYNYPCVTSKNLGLTLYFYPHTAADACLDPIADAVRGMDCKAKPGYGYQGHTILLTAMFTWTRDDIAQLYGDKIAQGCIVRVVYNHPYIDRSVLKILRQNNVDVCDAFGKDIYNHAKTTLISGTVNGMSVPGRSMAAPTSRQPPSSVRRKS